MFESSARVLALELLVLCLLILLSSSSLSSAFLLHDDMGYGRFRLPDGSFLNEDFDYAAFGNNYDYEYESYPADVMYHHVRWPRSVRETPHHSPKVKVGRRQKMAGVKRHIDRT